MQTLIQWNPSLKPTLKNQAKVVLNEAGSWSGVHPHGNIKGKVSQKEGWSLIRDSLGLQGQGCSLVGTASDWYATEAGSVPRCSQGIFLPVIFQCTLSYSVQSHALTSVSTLKISSTGSHTFVWTHENTAHTVRNG